MSVKLVAELSKPSRVSNFHQRLNLRSAQRNASARCQRSVENERQVTRCRRAARHLRGGITQPLDNMRVKFKRSSRQVETHHVTVVADCNRSQQLSLGNAGPPTCGATSAPIESPAMSTVDAGAPLASSWQVGIGIRRDRRL
jgi:hypothetical protein